MVAKLGRKDQDEGSLVIELFCILTVSVNILVVVLYYSFTISVYSHCTMVCSIGGNWINGYMGFLCIVS